jgi:hypothetical protein
VLELDHLKHDAYAALRHGWGCPGANRDVSILEPVRNSPVLCFVGVASNSVWEAEPVRNGASGREFVSEVAARERRLRSGDRLPCLGRADRTMPIVQLRTVESSRLETVGVLCLQWFSSRSNKSSSRLEIGLGLGRRRLPSPLRSVPSSGQAR